MDFGSLWKVVPVAGVHPEHKFQIVQVLKNLGWLIGITGDGFKDAPALTPVSL